MNKEKLAKQYEPLVNKITKQYAAKVKIGWEDVKSMAWEGLAIAMETYDENKSTMNFTQFAGYAIRNNILTSLDNEVRTVKLSNYAQKKAVERGEALFNSVSIDQPRHNGDDDEVTPREKVLGMFEDEKFSDGDVFDYLKSRIDDEFSTRDCLIFYKSFGLNGFDDMKGKDIAKELNVSEGLVSQRLKKIIAFIRKDNDLCEVLSNLLK